MEVYKKKNKQNVIFSSINRSWPLWGTQACTGPRFARRTDRTAGSGAPPGSDRVLGVATRLPGLGGSSLSARFARQFWCKDRGMPCEPRLPVSRIQQGGNFSGSPYSKRRCRPGSPRSTFSASHPPNRTITWIGTHLNIEINRKHIADRSF